MQRGVFCVHKHGFLMPGHNCVAMNYIDRLIAAYLNVSIILFSNLEKIASGIGDKLAYTMQAIIQIITGLVVAFIYLWQLALLFIGCAPVLIIAAAVVECVS